MKRKVTYSYPVRLNFRFPVFGDRYNAVRKIALGDPVSRLGPNNS